MTFTKYLTNAQDLTPIQLLQFEIKELEKKKQELLTNKNTQNTTNSTCEFTWKSHKDDWNSHYNLILHSKYPIKTVCFHSDTFLTILPLSSMEFNSIEGRVFEGRNVFEMEFKVYSYPGHAFHLNVFMILNRNPLDHFQFNLDGVAFQFFDPLSLQSLQSHESLVIKESREECNHWMDISHDINCKKRIESWIESLFESKSLDFIWKSSRNEILFVEFKSLDHTLIRSNSPLILCLLKSILLGKAEEGNIHLQLKWNLVKSDFKELLETFKDNSQLDDLFMELKAIQTQEKGYFEFFDNEFQTLLKSESHFQLKSDPSQSQSKDQEQSKEQEKSKKQEKQIKIPKTVLKTLECILNQEITKLL